MCDGVCVCVFLSFVCVVTTTTGLLLVVMTMTTRNVVPSTNVTGILLSGQRFVVLGGFVPLQALVLETVGQSGHSCGRFEDIPKRHRAHMTDKPPLACEVGSPTMRNHEPHCE